MNGAAGRFAPSPTGPLHHGSLLAATASYLDARSRGQRWLVRIDDLDTPRNAAGAESDILSALERHDLKWDGPVQRQSEHVVRYQQALARLAEGDQIYYCSCSRRTLRGHARYPGTCRERRQPAPNTAIRLDIGQAEIHFHDLIAGPQHEYLARSCGDFVIRRRDGLFAYQLATAVDDGAEEIGWVVRGGDLLDNTARQIHIMMLLGLSPPAYAHLPILTDAAGAKLSKQTHARPLDPDQATANLLRVYEFLSLSPPADAARWKPAEVLAWGVESWSIAAVRGGPRPFRY